MGQEKPEYNKQKVNWAGRIISGRKKATKEEKEEANKIFENWRASHSYPLHIFQMRLKKRAELLDKESIVAQRLKRSPAIRNKLKRSYNGRKPSMDLHQIQDIGGCRAILSNLKLAKILYKKDYLKGDLKHTKSGEKDYVKEPKEDGYRGFHLVYDYISDKNKKEYNGLKIEVQIRSKLQHLWATAVETIDFITKQAMKFSMGEPKWSEFFLLVSSAFAGLEGYQYFDNTIQEERKLFLEIKKRESELKAIDKMNAFATAIREFNIRKGEKKKKPKFFLLELNLKDKVLLIGDYSEKEKEKAIEDYSKKEKQYINNQNYDVVLVSVDDPRDLPTAYPNYFADTKEFIYVLSKIVNKY